MNKDPISVFGPKQRTITVTGSVIKRKRQSRRKCNHLPYLARVTVHGILIDEVTIYIHRSHIAKKNIEMAITDDVHEKNGHEYFVTSEWAYMVEAA